MIRHTQKKVDGMKKLFAITLILILAFTLFAGCGGGGNGGGGNGSGGGNAAQVSNDNEDPCPCCPECIQKECECIECGESDDCECKMPGGGGMGPLAFKVEYRAHYVVSGGVSCDIRTSGEAIVRMDQTNEAGHFGRGEGVGRYDYYHLDEWELRHPEETFDFIVQLSDYDPFNDKSSMIVSFDRLENEEAEIYTPNLEDPDNPELSMAVPFIELFFMFLLNEFMDEDTGFFTFPMMLEDWSAHETFKWDGGNEKTLELTITITPVT
jgi:hypothetical protein